MRTTDRIVVVATLALLVAAIFVSSSYALTVEAPDRISAADARYAAHSVFDNFAQAQSLRLSIAPCKPYRARARRCSVRVGAERFVVTAFHAPTRDDGGFEVMAAARRVRA